MRAWMMPVGATIGAILILAVAVGAIAAQTQDWFAEDAAVSAAPTPASDDAVNQEPIMTRQQLRVHAETGPPEGFEPVKRQHRLHKSDGQASMQCQDGGQCQNGGQGHSSGQGQNGRGSGQGIGGGWTSGQGADNS